MEPTPSAFIELANADELRDEIRKLGRRVDSLEATSGELRGQIQAAEQRLEQRIVREMKALHEKWANIATGITANSEAVVRGFTRLASELDEVKAEQEFIREQQKLIGRGMDLLLIEAGLQKVVNPDE